MRTRAATAVLATALILPSTRLAGQGAAPAAAPSVAADPRVVQALSLLTAWFDAEQAHRRLPGVSLAVVRDQELLYARGFGYAHVETKSPATAGTMYSICSISLCGTTAERLSEPALL